MLMEKGVIIQKINEALTALYEADGDLIRNKTNEETIVAHLVGYLRPIFFPDGWNIDAEYNRDGKDPKKDSSGNLIFPDIIIHNRTADRENRFSPTNNLVALEVKGYWNKENRDDDTQKLRDIGNRYGYQYLFRIELTKGAGQLMEVR